MKHEIGNGRQGKDDQREWQVSTIRSGADLQQLQSV